MYSAYFEIGNGNNAHNANRLLRDSDGNFITFNSGGNSCVVSKTNPDGEIVVTRIDLQPDVNPGPAATANKYHVHLKIKWLGSNV